MTTVYDDMPRPRRLDDVRGWFPPLDQVLFEKLLTRQETLGERGDRHDRFDLGDCPSRPTERGHIQKARQRYRRHGRPITRHRK